MEQDTEQNLCIMCGADADGTSVLCGECRDNSLRLNVPVWVIGFLLLVCVAAAGLSLQLPDVMDTYKVYLQAERDMKAKRFEPAVFEYLAVLEKYDSSVPIVMKAVESAMGAQFFDGAGYIMNEYLLDKSLDDAQYDYAMLVSDFIEREYDTQDACMEVLSGYSDDVDAAKAELTGMLGQPEYNDSYIYFLLANISPEKQEQVHYLEQSAYQNRFCTYTLAYYGNALRRIGDYDAAMGVYEDALAKNALDTYAMRGVGIVEQLRGETLRGLETIQAAYEIAPDGLYISEAMIIALCENGQRDEALAIKNTRLAEGYEFEQDLFDYLDGTLTMEQYYMQ